MVVACKGQHLLEFGCDFTPCFVICWLDQQTWWSEQIKVERERERERRRTCYQRRRGRRFLCAGKSVHCNSARQVGDARWEGSEVITSAHQRDYLCLDLESFAFPVYVFVMDVERGGKSCPTCWERSRKAPTSYRRETIHYVEKLSCTSAVNFHSPTRVRGIWIQTKITSLQYGDDFNCRLCGQLAE